MIHIQKFKEPIPESLKLPSGEKEKSPAKTTDARRKKIIQKGCWIDQKTYSSRYKQKDIKAALEKLYRRKCAYCETKVEQWHVEHYRPKSIYYWLAFSWDNLLFCCPTCNQHKGDDFAVFAGRAEYRPQDYSKIHDLCATYLKQEQPGLLHPEHDKPETLFRFHRDGSVTGIGDRATYTLEACKLSRKPLNDLRLSQLQKWLKGLDCDLLGAAREQQADIIKRAIKRFARCAHDADEEFIAFRRFVLKNLLADLIKEKTSG